jgi:hypothetical protein
MSELKALVARKIDDGSCDPVPCIEVYLKSEVDKVIEEKDDEIRNLKRWLCVARHEVAKARGKNSSNKYRAKFKR